MEGLHYTAEAAKKIMQKYPELTIYEALDIATKINMNVMFDSIPPTLTEIAQTLERIEESIINQ